MTRHTWFACEQVTWHSTLTAVAMKSPLCTRQPHNISPSYSTRSCWWHSSMKLMRARFMVSATSLKDSIAIQCLLEYGSAPPSLRCVTSCHSPVLPTVRILPVSVSFVCLFHDLNSKLLTNSNPQNQLKSQTVMWFTPDLKLISFTNPFLHSHCYSFRAAFTDLSGLELSGGVEHPPTSSCLQTPIFEWKSALNFNPWAKFQTFRQLTPPVLLGQFQHCRILTCTLSKGHWRCLF